MIETKIADAVKEKLRQSGTNWGAGVGTSIYGSGVAAESKRKNGKPRQK